MGYRHLPTKFSFMNLKEKRSVVTMEKASGCYLSGAVKESSIRDEINQNRVPCMTARTRQPPICGIPSKDARLESKERKFGQIQIEG